MNEAFKLAQKAEEQDEVPVGALVVQNDRIIATGFNQRERDHDPTAHAEMIALQKATRFLKSWRLNDCILVVTLEPCPMCLAAAQQARIGKIYFGARDKKGGALSLGYSLHEDVRTNHRFKVIYHEFQSGSQILTRFFKQKRLKPSKAL
jgi:tRNA(adenine34) deaminase